MSLSSAAVAARAMIARSDRLFFDTQALRFVTGLTRREEVPAPVVKELLDAGELRTVTAQDNGVIVMALSDLAFRRVLMTRKRKVSQKKRPNSVTFRTANLTGPREPGMLLDDRSLSVWIGIPLNDSLLGKLLALTIEAFEAFKADPLRRGLTGSMAGYIVPLKTYIPKDYGAEVLSCFESVDLSVMVNAANAQYTFGVAAQKAWLGTENILIGDLVEDSLFRLGKQASSLTRRRADQVLNDPLVTGRVEHRDEADPIVLDEYVSSLSDYEGSLA